MADPDAAVLAVEGSDGPRSVFLDKEVAERIR